MNYLCVPINMDKMISNIRGLIVGALIAVVVIGCGGKKKKGNFRYFQNYQSTFRDLNDKHLIAARQWGIRPIKSDEDLDAQLGKLDEISSCRLYEVDDLSHSLPYLVPRAVDLLETIAGNFKDSLSNKGLSRCKIIVTSLLRTNASVKKLRQGNTNASANSAHIYGTTFDVAYARYKGSDGESQDKLKSVLAEVLRDLQKKKKCYVRYEYKQGCFHITVR